MIKNNIQYNQGFSLIEMIVSLGIFAIVVTTAVGSLIVVMSNNQKLQAEQSAMTNLAFALDSMTREIRMGYAYVCGGVNNDTSSVGHGIGKIFKESDSDHGDMDDTKTMDCGSATGDTVNNKNIRGISFVEGGESLSGGADNRRILYYYDSSLKNIMRRVGNETAQPIMSSGLTIENARFFVTGSETLKASNDTKQPTVTIQIEATSNNNVTSKTYYLQTTITQRTLDI